MERSQRVPDSGHMRKSVGVSEQFEPRQSGSIFISYRRKDSLAIAGRIDDHLRAAFGHESVFRDIDSIPPGADFVAHLERKLARADIIVAIIGKGWDTERLKQEGDFVRLELERGLALQLPIIPVLADGATMPRESELSESLRPLLRRQAVKVDSDQGFRHQISVLLEGIRRALEEAKESSLVCPNIQPSAVTVPPESRKGGARLGVLTLAAAVLVAAATVTVVAVLGSGDERVVEERESAAVSSAEGTGGVSGDPEVASSTQPGADSLLGLDSTSESAAVSSAEGTGGVSGDPEVASSTQPGANSLLGLNSISGSGPMEKSATAPASNARPSISDRLGLKKPSISDRLGLNKEEEP